jgi:hypothetical protein
MDLKGLTKNTRGNKRYKLTPHTLVALVARFTNSIGSTRKGHKRRIASGKIAKQGMEF